MIFVPGPVEVHCGVGNGGALQFLGWSEDGVTSTHRPFFEDVKSDLAGPLMPTDVQVMGEDAIISMNLKVFSWSAWEKIASRVPAAVGGAPGGYPFGSIGALMVSEGYAYRLLIYRPYAAKQVFLNAGMRPAYNYFASWLLGPDDIKQSMRAMAHRTIFRAISVYQGIPSTSGSGWGLYNADIAGKPAAVAA